MSKEQYRIKKANHSALRKLEEELKQKHQASISNPSLLPPLSLEERMDLHKYSRKLIDIGPQPSSNSSVQKVSLFRHYAVLIANHHYVQSIYTLIGAGYTLIGAAINRESRADFEHRWMKLSETRSFEEIAKIFQSSFGKSISSFGFSSVQEELPFTIQRECLSTIKNARRSNLRDVQIEVNKLYSVLKESNSKVLTDGNRIAVLLSAYAQLIEITSSLSEGKNWFAKLQIKPKGVKEGRTFTVIRNPDLVNDNPSQDQSYGTFIPYNAAHLADLFTEKELDEAEIKGTALLEAKLKEEWKLIRKCLIVAATQYLIYVEEGFNMMLEKVISEKQPNLLLSMSEEQRSNLLYSLPTDQLSSLFSSLTEDQVSDIYSQQLARIRQIDQLHGSIILKSAKGVESGEIENKIAPRVTETNEISPPDVANNNTQKSDSWCIVS